MTVPEVRIAAEPRTEFGKGPARRARRAGRVPAVLYGHGTDPRPRRPVRPRALPAPRPPARPRRAARAAHGERADPAGGHARRQPARAAEGDPAGPDQRPPGGGRTEQE